MLLSVRTLRAGTFGLFKHPFEVGGHDQPRAFLIYLRDTVMEGGSGKATGAALLRRCQGLQLLQSGTRREQVARDPDIQTFILLLV